MWAAGGGGRLVGSLDTASVLCGSVRAIRQKPPDWRTVTGGPQSTGPPGAPVCFIASSPLGVGDEGGRALPRCGHACLSCLCLLAALGRRHLCLWQKQSGSTIVAASACPRTSACAASACPRTSACRSSLVPLASASARGARRCSRRESQRVERVAVQPMWHVAFPMSRAIAHCALLPLAATTTSAHPGQTHTDTRTHTCTHTHTLTQ